MYIKLGLSSLEITSRFFLGQCVRVCVSGNVCVCACRLCVCVFVCLVILAVKIADSLDDGRLAPGRSLNKMSISSPFLRTRPV